MPGQEQISFEIDPRQVLDAVSKSNAAITDYERKTGQSLDRIRGNFERLSNFLIQYNDKSRQATDRLVQSIEKQAAAYGKTGVERLIAQRDQLIRRLGDEQQAIDRVTAAYAKMISAESGQGGGWQNFGRSIKEFVEQPMRSGTEAVTGFLEKMGPTAIAVGGVATAVVALGAASYESAKSLAEFGIRVRDVELRTGLSAREVGQFSFAARAVGQDVSIVERLMRGLSEAMVDTSEQGRKAREALSGLGISPRDTQGNLKSTSDMLREISTGLERIPAGAQQIKVARDIFSRVGTEALPFILELNKNLGTAGQSNLGFSEQTVQAGVELNRQLALAQTNWETFKRQMQEILTIPIKLVFISAFGGFGSGGGGISQLTVGGGPSGASGPFPQNEADRQRAMITEALMNAQLGPTRSRYAPGAGAILDQAESRMAAASSSLKSYLNRPGDLLSAQDQLTKLKQDFESARVTAEQLADTKLISPEVARQAKQHLDETQAAFQRQTELVKELQRDEGKHIALLEKERDLIREGQGYYQIGTGPTASVVSQAQLNAANPVARSVPSLYGRGISPQQAVENTRLSELARAPLPGGFQVVHGEAVFVAPSSTLTGGFGQTPEGVVTDAARLKAIGAGYDQLTQQNQRIRLAALQQETQFTARLIELRAGPNGEIRAARDVAALREDALKREFAITGDIVKYREQSQANELELQLKIAEAAKRQRDEISNTSAGLYHTLFTNPRGFGGQLRDTVREAALRPITQGLGNLTARYLQPILFGNGGTGQDPVKLATDLNTQATMQNTAANLAVASALSGRVFAGGGGTVGGLGSSIISSASTGLAGGGSAGGGFTEIANPGGLSTYASDLPTSLGGTSGFGGPSGPIGGPGGGGGIVGGLMNLISGGRGGGIPIESGWPGGTISMGGTNAGGGGILSRLPGLFGSGGLSGLKGLVFNSGGIKMNLGGTSMNTAAGIGGFGGTLAGIASSPAAGIGGMMLAQHGLLGGSAGTWSGVAQGTLGGALLGFQVAGPLGAAIGAGVGAAIGIGEKLAGVESPEHEAQRLVKQIYGIHIDTNTAKQIVGIAQQKYAKHVSMAVRDPEVRKMLELYAAATGQKMPMSATTPHAGVLTEQGGRLYQTATYQFGNPGLYQSSLPVLGPSGATYPNPSAGLTLQVQVAGQGAKDYFEGNVVTPDLVQSRYSSAMAASNSRLQTSAIFQQPGLVIG